MRCTPINAGKAQGPEATASESDGSTTTQNGKSTTLRGRAVLASLAGLAVLAVLGASGTAAADGLTPATLVNAGWTCFNDPGAPRIVCSDPGHGRPTPNDPDAPPSYNFKIFALDGSFTGTAHLIRADLYAGQPCPQTGGAYFFIRPLGYYRCEHF